MVIVRKIVGSIILLLNWLFSPKGVKRDDQAEIDIKTLKLKLYQFNACPFCVRVRRAMKRMSLNIELRDAKNDTEYKQELMTHGGKVKVPCLRIEDEMGKISWMYESADIIRYLQNRFPIEQPASH